MANQQNLRPFAKGTSGNLKGRPKKQPIKSRIVKLLEKTLPRIEEELDCATPEQRRLFFIGMASLLCTPRPGV